MRADAGRGKGGKAAVVAKGGKEGGRGRAAPGGERQGCSSFTERGARLPLFPAG
jgi:hypothetical protein